MRETAVPGVDNRKASPAGSSPRGKVAIVTADKVEDIEFFYPYYRLIEAGYTVDVLTPAGGVLTGYREMKLQETLPLSEAHAEDYLAAFVPGGLAPDELVENEDALNLLRAFGEHGALIGSVCHGPRVLAKAGLGTGRNMTGFFQIEEEIVQGGASYLDQPVVEDSKIITSRRPGDLPQEMGLFLTRLDAIADGHQAS
jgi:protease I